MRRVHVAQLTVGETVLGRAEAHHLRDVLRLGEGTEVEAFDDAGAVARARLRFDGREVVLCVERIDAPAGPAAWTVAAALPKGNRADWMIEKLSELGTGRFIPLATARGVVMPKGTAKLERWQRIAAEAARQSRRRGVMRIDPLTSVEDVVRRKCSGDARIASGEASLAATESISPAWYLSPDPDAAPITCLLAAPPPVGLTLLIGPEGGWSDAERDLFEQSALTAVHLTATILRIETAAVAAAAIVAASLESER